MAAFELLANCLASLDNRIMSMEVRFSRREQVWAKVERYPWWPGKIVNIHIQAQQIIYKILFYNDPTYAYLAEQHIAPFPHFDRAANQQYPHHSRLVKAIKMADQAFAKAQSLPHPQESAFPLEFKKTSTGTELEAIFQSQQVITPIISNQKQQPPQEGRIEQENFAGLEQRHQPKCEETAFSPVYQPQDRSFNLPIIESITKENILHLLMGRREEVRSEYNYENRKKTIMRKAELKQRLLERYNLHDLSREEMREEGVSRERHRRSGKESMKRKIHRKKMVCHSLQHFREKCIKRFYMVAKKSIDGTQSLNLKQISVDLITRLAHASEENQLRFKTLFLALIKSIEAPHTGPFPDKIAAFTACLDRFLSEKPEDEEGSKMTQVSAQGH